MVFEAIGTLINGLNIFGVGSTLIYVGLATLGAKAINTDTNKPIANTIITASALMGAEALMFASPTTPEGGILIILAVIGFVIAMLPSIKQADKRNA